MRELGNRSSADFFRSISFRQAIQRSLKKLRPSVWFSIITALVGVAMLSQGLVKNNGQLIATRVILGIVEAGLYPGELS